MENKTKLKSEFMLEVYSALTSVEKRGRVAYNFNRKLDENEIQVVEMSGFHHQILCDPLGEDMEISVVSIFNAKVSPKSEKSINDDMNLLRQDYPIFYMSRENFRKIILHLVKVDEELKRFHDAMSEQRIDFMDSVLGRSHDSLMEYFAEFILDMFHYKVDRPDEDNPINKLYWKDFDKSEPFDDQINRIYDYLLSTERQRKIIDQEQFKNLN